MRYISTRWALLLVAAVVLHRAVPLHAAETEEVWRIVQIGNARVGYVRSWSELQTRGEEKVLVTEREHVLSLLRLNDRVSTRMVEHVEESVAGELRSYEFEMHNPPGAPLRRKATVSDGKLRTELEVNGKVSTTERAWDPAVKASVALDRLLVEQPLKPGEKRSFQVVEPSTGEVQTVRMEAAAAYASIKLLSGQSKSLLKVHTTAGPMQAYDDYLDTTGVVWQETMDFLGMATFRTSKAEALKSLAGEKVDLGAAMLIRVPGLKNASTAERIVYRVTTPAEDPAKLLASGRLQQVKKLSDTQAEVTVTASGEFPGASAIKLGAEYLEPNSYLQSDDALIRKQAAAAVGTETDPLKAALKMERWVFKNLKKKNFSMLLASAGEVARDLSGDCTEHGMLLAAMARARGIPSRVAVGLIYVRKLEAFSGHMWTEVNIQGTWVPLDATLGDGRVGADHIKVSDTTFAADDASGLNAFLPLMSIIGKMKIEVVEVK